MSTCRADDERAATKAGGVLCRPLSSCGLRLEPQPGRERPRRLLPDSQNGVAHVLVALSETGVEVRAVPPRVVRGIGFGSMVVLRCTQKLLTRLHVVETPPAESTTRLGDWYGNILRIGHRQMLILVSEKSRIPVVIPIREARRLATVFPDTVCDVLATVGVSEKDIAEERSRMSEIAFGPTRNRSVLGTLNDFAHVAKYADARRAEPESPEELMRFLAQTPILPLDGKNPIDLTLEVFGGP